MTWYPKSKNTHRTKEDLRNEQRRRMGLPKPTRPESTHCELCSEKLIRAPRLDHCHLTGGFRGWLCVRCNTGLGMLGDTIAGLAMAMEYLLRYEKSLTASQIRKLVKRTKK